MLDTPTDGSTRTATTREDRGVSELLGAILLFGLVVSVLVLLQANAVPSENEQVEFDHSQRIQTDLLTLDSEVDDVAALGRDQATVLDMGPTYPSRFLLVNPGPASGTLSTTPARFTLVNATATGETGDFWNGTERGYDSRRLSYHPDYNVYDGAPTTTVEHGAVTDRFPNDRLVQIDEGSFVSGRTVSLVALDGRRNVSQTVPLSVELVPLATQSRTVPVTGRDGPVTVRLRTDRSVAEWSTLLADQFVAEGGHVQTVRDGPDGTVEVVLEPGVTYDLRLSRVGVGSGLTRPDPAYVTTVGDRNRTVEAGGTVELAVSVRDAYNTPQSGVEVTFTGTNGSLSTGTAVTDADGEVRVTFTPDGTGVGRVTASIAGGTGAPDDPRSLTYRVTRPDAGQGGTPGELNPGGADAFQLGDVVLQGCNVPNVNTRSVVQYDSNGDCEVRATFTSKGRSRTVRQVRVGVFDADQSFGIPRPGQGNNQGQLDPRARPAEYQFGTNAYRAVGGDRVTLATADSFTDGESATYRFAFRLSGQRYNVIEGDVFVLTVVFGDDTAATYLVAPQD